MLGAGWAEFRQGACRGAEKAVGLTLFLHPTESSDSVMAVQSNSTMDAEDGIHGVGFEVMYKYSYLGAGLGMVLYSDLSINLPQLIEQFPSHDSHTIAFCACRR